MSNRPTLRRLSPDAVREIRRVAKERNRLDEALRGWPTLAALAKRHGVTMPTVVGIVARKTYRDVID